MSKARKAPVDRAVATIKRATSKDVQKVAITRNVAQAMQQSPDWGTATGVQAAVKVWSSAADGIDANVKVIADLRAQLKAAQAKQEGLRRDWAASKRQVISTVTLFCGGSADRVKAFNLDVITRVNPGVLAAPDALAVGPGTAPGEVAVRWAKGLATHGFVVQHATDPANAATVSAPTPSTRPRFTLGGAAPGANVSVRVAAIDPAAATGQSPWSAWVVGNAR